MKFTEYLKEAVTIKESFSVVSKAKFKNGVSPKSIKLSKKKETIFNELNRVQRKYKKDIVSINLAGAGRYALYTITFNNGIVAEYWVDQNHSGTGTTVILDDENKKRVGKIEFKDFDKFYKTYIPGEDHEDTVTKFREDIAYFLKSDLSAFVDEHNSTIKKVGANMNMKDETIKLLQDEFESKMKAL